MTAPATTTRQALAYVYVGYAFRYLYLLVLIPFYGRVLGAQEYGRLLAAMSLLQMVWMLTEYGFPMVGARDTAAATDRTQIALLYGRQMMGRLLMAGAGLAVGVGGTLLSPVLREAPLFGLLATLVGLVAGFNLGWHFQGTLRFRTSVVLEVCGFAISLPLILLLVRGSDDGWIVLATLLASSLLCTLAAHLVALRWMDWRAIRWQGGVALLRESTALFAHKGLTMMMASSSTYLLSLFASASQVGWYGAAERLAAVGLSLMQPANQVLVGTVSRRVGATESEASAFRLMRKGYLVMTGFGVLMLGGALVLAAPLVPLILGPEFGPTVPMLQILGLMFPFAAFSQVTSTYVLIPLRFDTTVSVASLLGACATITLIVGLGHALGGIGVAWARAAGYVLLVLVLLAVLQRKQLWKRILHS